MTTKPDDTAPAHPQTCTGCGTILCNWVYRGADQCCYCAGLDLDETCEPCADMAEVDDGEVGKRRPEH